MADCQRDVASAAGIFPPASITLTLENFTSVCRHIKSYSHCPSRGPHLSISPLRDCKVKRLMSNSDHLPPELSDPHSSYSQWRKVVTSRSNRLLVIIDKEGLQTMVFYTGPMDITCLARSQSIQPSVPLQPNPKPEDGDTMRKK